MHKKLIIEAYKKAQENRKEKGDNDPSKADSTEDLSIYLKDESGWEISPTRLQQYLNEAKALKNKKEDIKIKQIAVIYGLCNYLGFSSYKEFKVSNATLSEKIRYFFIKNRDALIISLITIICCIVFTLANRQYWMIWNGLEYVEVSFDIKKFEDGELKIYSADKIRNFKKIPNPDCNTIYINEKGDKVTWYYKRGKNDLEIFTSSGVHPINGKALDDITEYMIREHICPEY